MDIDSAAEQAADHPAVENLARAGFAASGLLHLILAWIIAMLATGNYRGEADQSGAMQLLASHSSGRIALWLSVLGFLGLGFWQLTQVPLAFLEATDRVKAAAKAVLYAALAWTAFTYARGGSSSGQTRSTTLTARLLEHGWGSLVLYMVGLGVVATGGYHVYKGLSRKFLENLTTRPPRWAIWAGMAGYPAKGIALMTAGFLVILATANHDPDQGKGLDAALRTLGQQPFGRVLLGAIGLGIAAFAVYCFARARYAKV